MTQSPDPPKVTSDKPVPRNSQALGVVPTLRRTDQIVLNVLHQVPSASTRTLAQLCALPTSTIFDTLKRLERYGLVERHHEARTKRGRPTIFYSLSP